LPGFFSFSCTENILCSSYSKDRYQISRLAVKEKYVLDSLKDSIFIKASVVFAGKNNDH